MRQWVSGSTADDDPPMLFLPGVIMSMWGGQVRSLADNLGIELDEVRQRIEPLVHATSGSSAR